MARYPDLPRPPTGKPTEREQRLLREIAVLAQRLLSARREEFDQKVQESLQQTAAVAGADRSYLSVFGQRGEPGVSYEWIRRGMEAQLPNRTSDSAEPEHGVVDRFTVQDGKLFLVIEDKPVPLNQVQGMTIAAAAA